MDQKKFVGILGSELAGAGIHEVADYHSAPQFSHLGTHDLSMTAGSDNNSETVVDSAIYQRSKQHSATVIPISSCEL